MFKLIGFALGFWIGGFFVALLGLMLGALIDRIRALGAGAVNPLKNALRQAVFLETAFSLMGMLAKADGRISQEEVDHAERFMQQLGMTAEHRQQAIALFKRGAAPDFELESALSKFNAVCGHTRDLKQMLLVYLIVMAMADGHYHPDEEALLTQVAGRLGYGPQAFKALLDMVLNQTHFGAGQVNSEHALADAYKALGVQAESSDQELKRAYRKLMSQYHPDKLTGQGMPEDMIKLATEQTKEIQLAYDLIKRSRNLP
ncbi:MAG: co-chaperone DjlA [Gallionella sp.]|nr:co-chaperone DjlA [Gallionella sp.]